MGCTKKGKEYPKVTGAAAANDYLTRMVANEMRGPGDTKPALERLSRRYGLSFWTLEHIRKGRAKECDAGLFERIRAAYLDHCERKLRELEHELRMEKARGDARDNDLLVETEALLAKLAARKGKER